MDEESFNKFKEELENFTPLLPDAVTDYFMMKAGVECSDPNVKKYVSLVGQKFITDIAASAMQYHKIYQRAALKDKKMPREKKVTLQMCDLEKALEENGIDISRPFYYM